MTENPSLTSVLLIEWTAICNGEPFDGLSRRYAEHSFMERWEWARQELRTLEKMLGAWIVDAVGFEIEDEGEEAGLYLVMRSDPPRESRKLVEYVLTNARACLEHLSVAIATENEPVEAARRPRDITFSILLTQPHSNDKKPFQGLHLWPPAARAMALSLQPFNAFSSNPRESPLAKLDDLAAIGRHRRNSASAAASITTDLGFTGYASYFLADHGEELVGAGRRRVGTIGPGSRMEIEGGSFTEIRLSSSGSTYDGDDLITLLREVVTYIGAKVLLPLASSITP